MSTRSYWTRTSRRGALKAGAAGIAAALAGIGAISFASAQVPRCPRAR